MIKQNKKSYPIRSIRLSDKTWKLLKERRWKSMKGWEQFIKDTLSPPKGLQN